MSITGGHCVLILKTEVWREGDGFRRITQPVEGFDENGRRLSTVHEIARCAGAGSSYKGFEAPRDFGGFYVP